MILRLKRPRYFPLKKGNGFVIVRTCQPMRSLGFVTFKTKRVAIASGKRWYGSFRGYDKMSYLPRK